MVKDINRENLPSNKTQALTKNMNREIWGVGTLNLLFIRGSYIQIKFSKNEVVLTKRCSEIMKQICRKTPLLKSDFQ